MRKMVFYLGLGLFLLSSCGGTYVTKSTIDSDKFVFEHAGTQQSLLIELKEIRTTVRNHGIFRINKGPYRKDVSFAYAIYASVSDGQAYQEIFELPCDKKASISDFITELQVKRSKKRDHFAIGYKNEVLGVFDCFKKVSFLSAYPMDTTTLGDMDFNHLNFNSMDRARTKLLNHITGDKLLIISDKQLKEILLQLSPRDELNYEFSYSVGSNLQIFKNTQTEIDVINHCKKDQNWRQNALKSIKNRKTDSDVPGYIRKLNAIGGTAQVREEDEIQYNLFLANEEISYFEQRVSMDDVPINKESRKKLKTRLLEWIKNPCTCDKISQMGEVMALAEKLKITHTFDLFFENYEKSSCVKNTLHEFNDEFLFVSSSLGASDRRKWVNFVADHFNLIQKNQRSWDYKNLENDLSCEQKRKLLTTYRKDIDVFDSMEIPDCK